MKNELDETTAEQMDPDEPITIDLEVEVIPSRVFDREYRIEKVKGLLRALDSIADEYRIKPPEQPELSPEVKELWRNYHEIQSYISGVQCQQRKLEEEREAKERQNRQREAEAKLDAMLANENSRLSLGLKRLPAWKQYSTASAYVQNVVHRIESNLSRYSGYVSERAKSIGYLREYYTIKDPDEPTNKTWWIIGSDTYDEMKEQELAEQEERRRLLEPQPYWNPSAEDIAASKAMREEREALNEEMESQEEIAAHFEKSVLNPETECDTEPQQKAVDTTEVI